VQNIFFEEIKVQNKKEHNDKKNINGS